MVVGGGGMERLANAGRGILWGKGWIRQSGVTKDLLVNRVVLVCHKTTGASGSGGSLSY